MLEPHFKIGATGVPNQENVTIPAIYVTYHDNCQNVLVILLPNRELMQA
jgi:hypothetical protein